MKKLIILCLSGILIFTSLVGCSSETDTKGSENLSRDTLEKQAISIYEDVNGIGAAKRDGFADSIKNLSDSELRMILE